MDLEKFYVDFTDEINNIESQSKEQVELRKKMLEKVKSIVAEKSIDERPYFTNVITMDIQKRKETIDAIAYLAPFLMKLKRGIPCAIHTKDLVNQLRIYGFRYRDVHHILSTPRGSQLIFLGDICFYLIIVIEWIEKPLFKVKQDEQIDIYAPYVYKKEIPNVKPIADRDPDQKEESIDENLMKQEEEDIEYLRTPNEMPDGIGIIQTFSFHDRLPWKKSHNFFLHTHTQEKRNDDAGKE